ncbi:hypothetical protein VP01_8154g1 [Puccinia sorghi]|uniref:Uncharacterized protein n=1 Tax=Puccinia sorghi TaxID=27349 RepID=A0A0L6UC92_9BASI|nr:hypothetical protein VP01_8154g1 [Puccinia sorghi]
MLSVAATTPLIKIPPPQLLCDWARTVACSILTISAKNPKVPTIPTNTSAFSKRVMILTWLDNLKENFPTTEKDKETEGSANEGSFHFCSVQVVSEEYSSPPKTINPIPSFQLPSLPHEKVWLNLGWYICEIFSSVCDFPDDVSKYTILRDSLPHLTFHKPQLSIVD